MYQTPVTMSDVRYYRNLSNAVKACADKLLQDALEGRRRLVELEIGIKSIRPKGDPECSVEWPDLDNVAIETSDEEDNKIRVQLRAPTCTLSCTLSELKARWDGNTLSLPEDLTVDLRPTPGCRRITPILFFD